MSDSSLIAALLDEQADLSAVERFAQRHVGATEPILSRQYRDLVPLSAPRPGEQYAFAVDLDACTGCKACVTACHNLNGLDPDESWRRVGTLVGEADGGAVQSVTMACHHCADPGCLRGCPVGAYEKDGLTGIVRHLDDQCIGCRYCVMMCPYDVPQYSPSRGIVRKCDMCQGRLAAGEAPACVQSCPNEAIRIRVVTTEASETMQMADAPDATLTRPTTRYGSRRATAWGWRAIDVEQATPADPHEPLVVMLVGTQLAVGLLAAALAATAWLRDADVRGLATGAGVVLLAALATSVLHLGRPLRAWRVFLGLGTSWLSREIVAFGGTAVLTAAYVESCWLDPIAPTSVRLGAAAVTAGLVGVGCSAMVYHATGRHLWRFGTSGSQFFGTTLLLGASVLAFAASAGSMTTLTAACSAVIVAVTALKLAGLRGVLDRVAGCDSLPLVRTAQLLRGSLWPLTVLRTASGLLGGIVLPIAALATGTPLATLLAFGFSLVGEGTERALFFRAVSPARMPGSL